MVNYLLQFKYNLNVKTVLPIFWNYFLFTTIFTNLINDPYYILLFLSMEQNKLNKIKKFLFYKLKILKFKVILKQLTLYKKTPDFIFLKQIFLLFVNQLYFHVLTLVFSRILAFIPIKFRFNNVKNQLSSVNNKVFFNQNCYLLHFNLNYQFPSLLQNSFKFIKKFVNDKIFLSHFLQTIYFFLFKNTYETPIYLREFLKLKAILHAIYCAQFDYFSFFTITKIVLNLPQQFIFVYKNIIGFVKTALNYVGQKYFFFNIKKTCFFRKKTTTNQYFSYLRINQVLLIFFFGSFLKFSFFKHQVKLFYKSIFNIDNKHEVLREFLFMGFTIFILKNLKKLKSLITFPGMKKILRGTGFLYIVPLKHLLIAFIKFGVLSIQNKPKMIPNIISFCNNNIFIWYLNFFLILLIYYKKCSNFKKFILKLYYICKWSLISTLAKKHQKPFIYILKKYITAFFSIFLKVIKSYSSLFILKKNSKINSFTYIYNYASYLRM